MDAPRHRSSRADHPDIREVLPRFLARLPGNVRQLRQHQADGDRAGLRILAHQLRGAGSSFGFEPLTRRAGELEELILADAGDTRIVQALGDLIGYIELIEGYQA
jgi:HPt (histidine-containing phosphotransfer) domain-containing protein